MQTGLLFGLKNLKNAMYMGSRHTTRDTQQCRVLGFDVILQKIIIYFIYEI